MAYTFEWKFSVVMAAESQAVAERWIQDLNRVVRAMGGISGEDGGVRQGVVANAAGSVRTWHPDAKLLSPRPHPDDGPTALTVDLPVQTQEGRNSILDQAGVVVAGMAVQNISMEMPSGELPRLTVQGVVTPPTPELRNMTSASYNMSDTSASYNMSDLRESFAAERARREREDEARRLDQAADEALKDLEGSPEGDWRRQEWRADGDLFL